MSAIDKTLDERGTRYGAFTGHAEITQQLKRAMGRHPGWKNLADDQREALEMIAHKIGRILNGDPNYIDSWHDIIGYTRLVEQRLEKAQQPVKQDESQATSGTSPVSGLKQHIDRAIADLSRQMREADSKSIETCDCPACELERRLHAVFHDAGVEVHFISEDTGRTD